MQCLLAAWLPVLVGCGTAANTLWWTPMEGGMRVYGGVRADAEVLCHRFSGESDAGNATGRCKEVVFCAIDLPLSAAADTLTLPVTVPTALARQFGKRDPASGPVDPSARPFSPP
jgi:uncharacterized protein YceK